MKFGKQIKQLADPAHLNHCISYDVLKQAINVVVAADRAKGEGKPDIKADIAAVDEVFGPSAQAHGAGCNPPDSRFHGLLQHELDKVNRFFALQLRTLLDTLREAQRPLLRHAGMEGTQDDDALCSAERFLDAAAEELVTLEHFRRLNFTGFRKIVKKFDKRSSEAGVGKGTLAAWFVPQLLREFFVATPLDSHLLALAWGYASLRRHRRGSAEVIPPEGAAPAPALAPASTTFWLTPSARMRALCTLVKRFEIVVPPSGAVTEGTGSAGAIAEQQGRLLHSMTPEGMARLPCRLSADSSLVYYDTPGFPEYLQRIGKGGSEGPAGFRCRQTLAAGCEAAAGDELVERDGAASALREHAFTPIEGLQAPDALRLSAQNGAKAPGSPSAEALQEAAAAAVAAAASGGEAALSPEQRGLMADFAREVAAAAERGPLTPAATVCSARVLLHGDTAATLGVSIALNEDVQFSLGHAGPAATAPSDAIDFPYCLLEVSGGPPELGRLEAPGTWLEELRSHAALRSVAGFSIGAHAVAALHEKEVPELPHWYEHLSTVERSAPPEAWGLVLEWRAAVLESKQGEEKAQEAAADATSGAAAAASGAAPVPPATVPSGATQAAAAAEGPDLLPKNFLASERTMLEWMHTVVALAFLGIALWRYSLRGARPTALGLLNAQSAGSLTLGCYSLTLVVIAVGFAWYAVLAHLRRMKAMLKKEHTEQVFNTRVGPVLFAMLVGMALVVHLVMQAVPLLLGVDEPSAEESA